MTPEVDCGICGDPYTMGTPVRRRVLLPCLHAVCAQCMGDMLQDSAVCRDCYEPFSVTTVLDLGSPTNNNPAPPLCVIHDDDAGGWASFCSDCNEVICTLCADHAEHAQTSLADTAAHTDASLLAGAQRIVTQLEQLRTAKETIAELRTQLLKHRGDLLSDIDGTFDTLLAKLEQNRAAGDDSTSATSSGADNLATDDRRTAFEAQRAALKQRVHSELDGDVKTIDLQLEALDVVASRMGAARSQALAITGGSAKAAATPAVSQLRLLQAVLDRIRTLLRTDMQLQPLVHNNIRFDLAQVDPDDALALPAHRVGIVTRVRDVRRITAPMSIIGSGTETRVRRMFRGTCGIAQRPDGSLLVSDHSRLHMLTPAGVPISEVDTQERRIRHIAVLPDGRFWTAGDNKLVRYSDQLKPELEIAVDSALGVAAAPDGTVIATQFERNSVMAFSKTGELRWTSIGTGFKMAVGAAATATEVFVCDYFRNRVQVLALADGEFRRTIGVGHLLQPSGVAVMPGSASIVVADRWHAYVWTVDGDLLGRWGGDSGGSWQFRNHLGDVAVLSDSRIAIADYDNDRVLVF